MLKYLHTDFKIQDKKRTKVPTSASQAMYGGKLPSSWMVKVNNRWLRVYIMNYGNIGTAYVLIKGEQYIVLQSDLE
jgi:hypothetical protein